MGPMHLVISAVYFVLSLSTFLVGVVYLMRVKRIRERQGRKVKGVTLLDKILMIGELLCC